MNKFEESFFKKFVPEWQEIRWVIHVSVTGIFSSIFLWICLWILLPAFLYYYSGRIQDYIPFIFLELYLFVIYLKFIYDIFDWYNDVLIVTTWWVIELDWKLFKTKSQTVEYWKIEWIEVQQWWSMDKIFKKWNLIIHLIWDDELYLPNAANAYGAVDLIEQVWSEGPIDEEKHDYKFDLIMEALGWVIENYLDKKVYQTDKVREKEKAINDAYEKQWTIDLR